MTELDPDYLSAVQAHVNAAGEESLSRAYELGRQALADGLGLLDIISLYEEIIQTLVMPREPAQRPSATAAVSDFFREFVSPFEMTFRGYREANHELQRLNQELSNVNRELLQKQAQLIQSAKMASLGELVAGVAHEINNPLAFVVGHFNTAQRCVGKVAKEIGQAASTDTTHALDRAQNRLHEASLGLERIRELVLKLRAFSRLDEGEQKIVSIQECVNSVLMILQHRLEGRIEVETHFGHPDMLECFPGLLNQALMNLIANSIDSIEGAGTISISTGADASGYAILVSDTGHGIPAELRERVMEPFFTTKPVGHGTGLGLPITYSIIEKHRGLLELSPRHGGGTLATIRLPIDR